MLSVGGFMLFITGYSFGVVNRNSNDVIPTIVPMFPDWRCGCGCGGNQCYNFHCSSNCSKYNRTYPMEWRTASEAIAYNSGVNFGYEQGEKIGYKNGMYKMRETSKEEFIAKFNGALKPLSELKKEFGIEL